MAAMADALQSNHTLHKLCFEFPHCNMEDILRNNGNSADKRGKAEAYTDTARRYETIRPVTVNEMRSRMKGREARRKSTATTPRKLARARSTLFLTTAQDEKSRRRTRRVGGCNRTGGGCADATATLGNSHQEWAGEEATQLQNGCRGVSHFGPRYKTDNKAIFDYLKFSTPSKYRSDYQRR